MKSGPTVRQPVKASASATLAAKGRGGGMCMASALDEKIDLLANVDRTVRRVGKGVDDLEHARVDTLGGRAGERRRIALDVRLPHQIDPPTDIPPSADQLVRRLEDTVVGWRRIRKVQLVESVNPAWKDLLPPN